MEAYNLGGFIASVILGGVATHFYLKCCDLKQQIDDIITELEKKSA